MHGLARGLDPSPVRPSGPPKSITVEDSFASCDTWDGVRAVLQVRVRAFEYFRGAGSLLVSKQRAPLLGAGAAVLQTHIVAPNKPASCFGLLACTQSTLNV